MLQLRIGLIVTLVLLTASGLTLRALGEGAASSDGGTLPPRARGRTQSAATLAPAPKAVLVDGWHEFGTLEPGERGQHWFTIQNQGDAELLLKRGAASCSCTSGELMSTRVPPGGETRVLVTWTPPRAAERFVQGVQVYTNDPEVPTLSLNVMGSVRPMLAADPRSVVFTETHPDDGKLASVLLHSQCWRQLDITAIEPSHDWFSVTLEKVSADELTSRSMTAAQRLRIVISPDASSGWCRGQVLVKARGTLPDGTHQERQIEIPVEALVVGDVSFQAPGYDGKATWRLGKLDHGQPLRRTMLVLVRGQHRDVTIERIDVEPSMLEVTVEKRLETERLTQYQLHLTVPGSFPEGVHVGPHAARVKVWTDHPHRAEWDLGVEFSVLTRD